MATEGWTSTTLGDVCREGGFIQTGPFGSQLHASDYVADGIPVIMPVNIGDGVVIEEGIARVPESDAERLARHRVEPGDIVYSRRGDITRRALVASKESGWLCGTGCLLVRAGCLADPTWLSYWLATPWTHDWLQARAVGATMPNLNTGILSEVPVALPDITEQRRIAGVVGALDDLIETNLRLVTSLWSGAEVAFSLAVMSAPQVKVGAVLDLKYGKALPASTRVEGDVLVVSSAGIIGRHNVPLVHGPGVVVGRKGTVGSVTWVPFDFFPIDTAFYVETDLPPLFAYFALSRLGLEHMNTDSAVPGLNRTNALAWEMPLPSATGLADFKLRTDPLIESAQELEAEARQLEMIRDELLPLLMSGRVSVDEAWGAVPRV